MQPFSNYFQIIRRFSSQVKKSIVHRTFNIGIFRYLPDYIADNSKNNFSHLNESKPWITYSSFNILLKILKPEMKVFEYGSGGSTLFYSSRVAEVISVEHDKNWFTAMKQELANREITNVKLNLCEPKKINTSDKAPVYGTVYGRGWEDYDFKSYVTKIDEYPDAHFDILVIDGRARPYCLQHGLKKIKPGGFLVYDNLDRLSYKDDFYSKILPWKIHDAYGPVIGYTSFTNTHIYQVPRQ